MNTYSICGVCTSTRIENGMGSREAERMDEMLFHAVSAVFVPRWVIESGRNLVKLDAGVSVRAIGSKIS